MQQGNGKTIISICDYTGEWPRPYLEAGYDVIIVDPKHEESRSEIMPNGAVFSTFSCTAAEFAEYLEPAQRFHGLMLAPPCTDFTISGCQWWPKKDEDGTTDRAVAIVRDCLAIRDRLADVLKWWVLENPVGRLNSLVPELKPFGPWYFQPNDFGETYTKKTGLWGTYTPPLPLFLGEDRSVEATEGSKMWANYGGKSERTKMLRSITPSKFAQAFFEVNP